MVDLKHRWYNKELLDADDIPFADIKQNMKELNTVNKSLGGHGISLKGFRELIRQKKHSQQITVCEIGCGGGDNLQAVYQYCNHHHIPVSFMGIDIKAACIDFAKQQYPALPATWITSDYALADLQTNKPSIIFSALFCHHFNEPELVKMLKWMKANSSLGFFINDLHRNTLAYYAIKWLTALFSKSYLVKHDAPLSVARGFKKTEWIKLLAEAGIQDYTIKWKWAFRYLIICKHGQ